MQLNTVDSLLEYVAKPIASLVVSAVSSLTSIVKDNLVSEIIVINLLFGKFVEVLNLY